MKKRISRVWLAVIAGISLITVPVFGVVQEQEFHTLELVKVYNSKEEIQITYPELFPQYVIQEEGGSINFYAAGKTRRLKHLTKKQSEVLREEQQKGHTIVWEKFYDYQILNNSAFMLYTEYERGYPKGYPDADPSALRKGVQKRVLYNGDGEILTELPLPLNYVEVSPDGQYFVAAQSGSMPSDFLYFYNIEGGLLKKHATDAYVGLEYSSNSEYVKVEYQDPSRSFGKVSLFTKMGEFITRYDYGKELHDYLFRFHVSNNAEFFLFSMFKNAYLLSGDGQILWQKPYTRVIDCHFYKEQNYLILYTPLDKRNLSESRKGIKIVSLRDGEILDVIEDAVFLRATQNGLVIKKGENYYEYTLR